MMLIVWCMKSVYNLKMHIGNRYLEVLFVCRGIQEVQKGNSIVNYQIKFHSLFTRKELNASY